MTGAPGPAASRTIRDAFGLPQRVCPASYPGGPYWGDYIGYAGVPAHGGWTARHLAAWSTDNGRGCGATNNIWQGRHLHVGASSWIDP